MLRWEAGGAVTVLVTGASGFLGTAVARGLVRRGDDVRTLQRRPSGVAGAQDHLGSIDEPALVSDALAGVDTVIHLAAKVSLAGDPREFERINIDGTRALLQAAADAGVTRFVHVSSPSVAHAGVALAGVGAEPASPAHARGEYARTKAEGEVIALAADGDRLRVLAIRPHLVWGPGDPQLVERIVARARVGRLPLIDGGTALIDSTYIDNAVSAIIAGADRMDTAHGRAYIVTNGEPRPVGELIASMCRAAGVAPPAWSVPSWLARGAGSVVERVWAIRPGADEPPMTRFLAEQLSTAHWFDLTETRAALDWSPEVSLDEGFSRLAAFYDR